MPTYLIAFRLEHNFTYNARYQSVMSRLRTEAEDRRCWDELTSLIVIKSSKSAEQLARSIYYGSDFMSTIDKLLVIDAHSGDYATYGEIEFPATLRYLMNGNGLAGLLSGT